MLTTVYHSNGWMDGWLLEIVTRGAQVREKPLSIRRNDSSSIRGGRIGSNAFSFTDGNKLRSVFNITELMFFEGESREIYGSYLETGFGSRRNTIKFR